VLIEARRYRRLLVSYLRNGGSLVEVGMVPTSLVAPVLKEAYVRRGRRATELELGVAERHLFGSPRNDAGSGSRWPTGS
jgi:hypothetical protein